MHIQQLEQSGYVITSQQGAVLAIDIGCLTPVERLAGMYIDTLLISHIHADHCAIEQVRALNPAMIFTGEECTAALAAAHVASTTVNAGETVVSGAFTIRPFVVDHGPHVTTVPAQNFGFLITVDGYTLYFAGDMYTPSGISVTELSVSAAFLPVGGHFTFDAEAALAFAQTFAHIDTIYPMHTEAVGQIDTHGKERFRALAAGTFTVAT